MIILFLIAILCVSCLPKQTQSKSQQVQMTTLVRVIDGDTIVVNYKGKQEKIRFLRINTPERGQPGYKEATQSLKGLIEGKQIRLEFEKPGVVKRGYYGRILAYVFVGNKNINVEMVRLGHSKFWTKYGRGKYAKQFEEAALQAH